MIHSSALVENLRLNWTSCPESTVIVGWDWSAWCVLCREKPQTMIQIFSHHTLTSYRRWVHITWLYWINGCAVVYRWAMYHSCCESICRLLCDYSGPPLYCPPLYRHPRLSPWNCQEPISTHFDYNATPAYRHPPLVLRNVYSNYYMCSSIEPKQTVNAFSRRISLMIWYAYTSLASLYRHARFDVKICLGQKLAIYWGSTVYSYIWALKILFTHVHIIMKISSRKGYINFTHLKNFELKQKFQNNKVLYN